MSPCNFGILLIFHYFLKSRALSCSENSESASISSSIYLWWMENILKLYNILTYYEKVCRLLLNSTDFLLQSGEAPDKLLTESRTYASINKDLSRRMEVARTSLPPRWSLCCCGKWRCPLKTSTEVRFYESSLFT